MGRTKPGTVQFTGARAGSRLIGSSHHNKGILIEVHQDQDKVGKRVKGDFTLIDAGLGKYAKYLDAFSGQRFDTAAELIDGVRKQGAIKCTHIVNRNCLKVAVEPFGGLSPPSNGRQEGKVGKSPFKYQVALSFAGQDRRITKQFAELLRQKGVTIFYDEYEKASLWGKDLYQHLAKVYKDYSQYCVVFVSKAYKRKTWTRHELKQAQARAFKENREYILPIKLDNTELPGLPETVGYLDVNDVPLDEIADVLVQKLGTI